jgi:hypothetical protein
LIESALKETAHHLTSCAQKQTDTHQLSPTNSKAMSSSQRPSKKQKSTNNTAGNSITRGPSHPQIKQRHKDAKSALSSLTPHQKSSVLQRYHGSSTALQRLHTLRHDDIHEDTSNLSTYQIRNLQKRRSQNNHAVRRFAERKETKRLENAMEAMHAEEILHDHTTGLIQVENDMEKTTQLTQEKLKDMLEENAARNIYDLELNDYSPYIVRYDRSGRYSLICGRKGHVAIVDQHTLGLEKEFYLGETTRDACFLQNGSMMAVAQERNVYIYDENGAEVHRLDGHKRVFGMEFLPYHWLLGELLFCLCVVYYCRY